ncbi:hypothetical protein [Saliphagus sp. LR7]|uniref:DUF7288 family protein n=1 Tax=Saliphagus sp. LR7 TaxID=2282654 RepID=UPI000DF82683|nr:hypothetical protein [Saliphagus sp. LR7]
MVSDDRGQAYTLEGFVGAIVLLMAVLLAVQSVVVSPSAGGDVDRSVQTQLQGEARDALVVAGAEGDLSHVVRYWNPAEEEYNASNVSESARGYYTADRFADRSYMSATSANEFGFGELLDKRFEEAARSYNVELVYQNSEDETESFYLVYQGSPDSSGVSASHTVTLTDDQELTAPGTTKTLREGGNESNGSYRIPDVDEESRLYNVVEVRLVVW